MLNTTQAAANRQANATNLVARHLADRPARHITRRYVGTMWVWKVESQTRPGVTYTVTLTADGWPADTCSCEDCTYRHQECKHIKAALALAAPAQAVTPTPEAAIKWTSEERRARRRTEPQEEI